MGRSRNALGYVRTGDREGEDDPLISVEAQRAAIEAYATFRGLNLEGVLVDEGVGGGVPLEARPGGAELGRWLTRPRVHSVVVLRLDRLFASARECVNVVERWEEKLVALHVLDLEGAALDTFSPQGRVALAVLRAAARMEEQQREAALDLDLKGLHRRKRGAKLLLGERVVRGFVVPDPVEEHAVQRIQELANEGKSLRLIAEALDQEGVPTKRRAKSWSKEAIRLILKRIEDGQVRPLRGGSQDTPQPAPTVDEGLDGSDI
ncbi:MAG: recombinase family protein [Planctomycetota bacterium]